MEKYHGGFKIKLMKQLDGPQEIKITLWLQINENYRKYRAIVGYHVIIAVSKYSLM
jgi:hypothetical protein